MTKVTSLRLEDELSGQLDRLATAMDRPKAWLIEQALRSYIQEQMWQVQAIQEALDDYKRGTAKLVPHEEVMERLETRIKAGLEQ